MRHILGKAAKKPAPPPRTSMLSPFEAHLSEWLKETPDLRAPAVLERLRPLGYTGGVSILRERLRMLRPQQPKEAFLSLRFAPGEVVMGRPLGPRPGRPNGSRLLTAQEWPLAAGCPGARARREGQGRRTVQVSA